MKERKYIKNLFARYFIALFFMITGLKIIYFIISPITFYLSYLTLFFYSPSLISNTAFIIDNYRLNFIPACTAASAYLLLILLTLTTDLTIKKIIKVIVTGFIAILIGNIIRIDILIMALIEKSSTLFDTLHLFFWQVLSTIYVVLVWIGLTKLFKIAEIPLYSDLKKVFKIYKESKK